MPGCRSQSRHLRRTDVHGVDVAVGVLVGVNVGVAVGSVPVGVGVGEPATYTPILAWCPLFSSIPAMIPPAPLMSLHRLRCSP